MKNSLRFASPVAVLGMVAAGLLALAGPAAADSSQCTTYKSGSYASCAGHAWFQSSGEHFYIESTLPSGVTLAEYRASRPRRQSAWQRLRALAGGVAVTPARAY